MNTLLITALLAWVGATSVFAVSPFKIKPGQIIPHSIALYHDVERQGDTLFLNNLVQDKCYGISDFGRILNDQISQVDTFGNCAIVYKDVGCDDKKSPFLHISKAGCSSGDLVKCKFNDRLSAFRLTKCG